MTTEKTIKIKKTTYTVIGKEIWTTEGFSYCEWKLQNKNTIKCLIYGQRLNDYTLWGKRGGNRTMTMIDENEITFN